ncbi:hypothetical protein Pcinc_001050 [Petrolisthes cinctipes]|uniref:Uncharacterized protein n=1 Tax=Petrolisthes cinctipes TaxID=88211 RepID=A0AAE1GNJ4_PETCI|nr:hypothetical protein Pcinc_001050 [Petrolisthes cinctipes]
MCSTSEEHHPPLQSSSPSPLRGRGGGAGARAAGAPHPHQRPLRNPHFTPSGPPCPAPRWNIRRADWSKFQAFLDEWWADYQPPDDLHQQERDLTEAIQTAATTAIPMCAPSRRRRTDWWYYNNEVREHNHRVNLHRKLYKNAPIPTT